MKYDVIIIGAGAAGLIALRELSSNGLNVVVLEARPVPGGRISTLYDPAFSMPVELGAEFLHGSSLPITLQLLRECEAVTEKTEGAMVTVRNGVWLGDEEQDEQFGIFLQQLSELKEDMPVQHWLDSHYPAGEYDGLRTSIRGFAEGFDLADISNASIQSLKEELLHDPAEQYRVKNGYGQMIDHLLVNYDKNTSAIHYSAPVFKVEYRPGAVKAFTRDNKEYESTRAIITVPVSILQAGDIEFVPALGSYQRAIDQLGFGSVIKILFQFKQAFWESNDDSPGFFLSNEAIPTWWTQTPGKVPLLTGWVGGPNARQKSQLPGDELYELAIHSVASIFKMDQNAVRQQLVHHKIVCWDNQPYAKGGYSYNTVDSSAAKKVLSEPVDNSLYFAGEAYSKGDSQGTVEAALQSGLDASKRVIEDFRLRPGPQT